MWLIICVFKVLLQENEHVLRSLLCSLLHMKEEEITSTEITNSIKLGESFTEKTFMLDVVINLNNARTINLEMQVINYDNWTERSLAYLGREFSKILKGANYADAAPVHQIGILNFTLFKDYPKFYSTYMMQELENHNIYSSKFALSVLDLTQIDNATDVDKSLTGFFFNCQNIFSSIPLQTSTALFPLYFNIIILTAIVHKCYNTVIGGSVL